MFFIFAIISFSIAYRRASSNGRNGYLWGLIASVAFILSGLSISFGIGVFIGFGIEVWNWQQDTVDIITITGSVLAVIVSFQHYMVNLTVFGSFKRKITGTTSTAVVQLVPY